jgi:hypothetical protein
MLSHWRVLQRSDAKLDFQPIDEEGRFSFDDYETVAEITFTKAGVELAQNNSERLLSFCFQLTNSIEEGWYEDEGDGEYYAKRIFKSPCRSTSVGDIIQNMDENKYWVVAPVGFNRVFPPVNAYLQMARRRIGLEAESFEAPKAPKWKKIQYKDEERYKPSIPAPIHDELNELLRSFEDGMEPYDIELSQYIVLEDKVVCFVGSYRESFYNHRTEEYRYKKKRHWFGVAYQTARLYSQITTDYLEARENYDNWWEQLGRAEKIMNKRYDMAGKKGFIEINQQMERRRIYQKKPVEPWKIVEENMWFIDGKNWQRTHTEYEHIVETDSKADAKERILEEGQRFVSTEPDWFRNVYVDMAKQRQGMAAEEETPSLEAILDFVHQRFAQGDLEVKHEEIAEHFGIETKVRNIMTEENCSKKYMVGEREWDGNYFMRYKGMPMFAYFSPRYGDKFYSIKNPFIQARAKGRYYENKDERKKKLRKIMFGADSSYCENCYAENGLEKRTFFKPYSNDEREYEQTFCRFCGDAAEPKPIDDEQLEGVKCYMCGKEANYIFEDLPTGAKPFCTEKCLCDYAGFPYMGEGYYGLRPIGGEPFNVKRVLHNTGRLDWRKEFNAPAKKEIGAEGMIYFVLVPFSLAILGSIGLGRILNRRATENKGDSDGLN